jgi:hypothetical protein
MKVFYESKLYQSSELGKYTPLNLLAYSHFSYAPSIVRVTNTRHLISGFEESEIAVLIDDTVMLQSLPPKTPVTILVLKTAEPSADKHCNLYGASNWFLKHRVISSRHTQHNQ